MMDIGLITGYIGIELGPLYVGPGAAGKLLIGIYMHNSAAPYNDKLPMLAVNGNT